MLFAISALWDPRRMTYVMACPFGVWRYQPYIIFDPSDLADGYGNPVLCCKSYPPLPPDLLRTPVSSDNRLIWTASNSRHGCGP